MFDPLSIIAYNYEGWGFGGGRIDEVRRALFIRELKDENEKHEKIPGSGRTRVYEAIDLDDRYEEGCIIYLLDSPTKCIRLVKRTTQEECLTHPLSSVREAAKKIYEST